MRRNCAITAYKGRYWAYIVKWLLTCLTLHLLNALKVGVLEEDGNYCPNKHLRQPLKHTLWEIVHFVRYHKISSVKAKKLLFHILKGPQSVNIFEP